MIDPDEPRLSIVRQCELVSISRSSFYFEGKGESPLNLTLMRLIDEQFLQRRSTARVRWLDGCVGKAIASAESGCGD